MSRAIARAQALAYKAWALIHLELAAERVAGVNSFRYAKMCTPRLGFFRAFARRRSLNIFEGGVRTALLFATRRALT
jgi:hypothetical protein